MRSQWIIGVVLTSALTALAAGSDATAPAPADTSAVQFLRVYTPGNPTIDDVFMARLEPALIDALTPQANQMLGISPETLGHDLSFSIATSVISNNGQDCVLKISLDLDPPAKPAANEFMAELTKRFPTVLDDLRLAPIKEQSNALTAKRDSLQLRITELGDDLSLRMAQLHKDGFVDTSTGSLSSLADKLIAQREDLQIARVGQNARRDALTAAVAKLLQQGKAQADADPVAQQLDLIAKAKDAEVERAPDNSNATNELQIQAAEAHARVLERREAVMQAVGGNVLTDIQRELSHLEIDCADTQARLDAVSKEADSVGNAASHEEADVSTERASLAQYQSALASVSKQLDDLRDQMDAQGGILVMSVDEKDASTP